MELGHAVGVGPHQLGPKPVMGGSRPLRRLGKLVAGARSVPHLALVENPFVGRQTSDPNPRLVAGADGLGKSSWGGVSGYFPAGPRKRNPALFTGRVASKSSGLGLYTFFSAPSWASPGRSASAGAAVASFPDFSSASLASLEAPSSGPPVLPPSKAAFAIAAWSIPASSSTSRSRSSFALAAASSTAPAAVSPSGSPSAPAAGAPFRVEPVLPFPAGSAWTFTGAAAVLAPFFPAGVGALAADFAAGGGASGRSARATTEMTFAGSKSISVSSSRTT